MSYWCCSHCGEESGMYGHYRFETDPESNPLEFCPQTVEVREKVTFRDQTYHNVRVGFACLVGHVCRD